MNQIERSVNRAPENAKIVIIGAGSAGIAAASKLFENGFNNVTILEAENRIGGRIFTTTFGNYQVDLGGQWIHGSGNNTAFDLAYPLNLVEKSNRSDYGFEQELFDSRGTVCRTELSEKIQHFFNHYEDEFNKYTDCVSVGEYVERIFEEQFKDYPEMLRAKRNYLHLLKLLISTQDSAETLHDVSLLGSNGYYKCEGDQMVNWKEKGFSMILDVLMKRYPEPKNELPVMKNTKLNTEVVSIDYSNASRDCPILITTASNQVYTADHVILTVSLGVLKEKHKSLFIPPLPSYKVNAIEGLGFGSVAKIIVLFDKPFWKIGNDKILLVTFLWNDKERKIIEADPEKQWLLGMIGGMSVEHKPNLFTLWILGKYAKDMESISEDKVFKYTMENLHRFLDKKYKISTPVAMVRSQWYTNQHFRGTYSYRSVRAYEEHICPETLERPITPENLGILFAGEATSSLRYSTVDGAIESGWNAANKLIDHYRKSSSKT